MGWAGALTPGVGPVGDRVCLWEQLLAGVVVKLLVSYITDVVLCTAQGKALRHRRKQPVQL